MRNPEKYLYKVNQIIDHRLGESSFSVEQLAKDFGQSRMSVYRNLKKITGLTPSQYLLNKRLEKSKRMLLDSNQPIKKIAGMIGFNKPSYFSKKFKETYGCTPTDYVKRRNNEKMLQK